MGFISPRTKICGLNITVTFFYYCVTFFLTDDSLLKNSNQSSIIRVVLPFINSFEIDYRKEAV